MGARVSIPLMLILFMCFAEPGNAWNPEGNDVGVLPGVDAFTEAPGHMAPDGAGGVYVVWVSSVTGLDEDEEIRLQRLDADGRPVWGSGGIVLADAGSGRLVGSPQVAADGSGGALVTYLDNLTTGSETFLDLKVERIDAYGDRLWVPDGVTLGAGTVVSAETPRVVGTGDGGALVAWLDTRPGWHVAYAQMLDASGNELGTAGGMDLFSTRTAEDLELESNGDTHAVLSATIYDDSNDVWFRVFELGGANPLPVWQSGVGLGTSQDFGARCAVDDGGGVYVAYFSDRNGARELWVEGFNGVGSGTWSVGSVPVYDLGEDQWFSSIAIEPVSGDILVAWADNRTPGGGPGPDLDIYAQRFRPDASPVWQIYGVEVTETTGNQQYPHIMGDGEGGALVLWSDDRDPNDVDVYAQRLDVGGRALWVANGMGVLTRSERQFLTRPVYASPGELRLGFSDIYTGFGSRDIRLQRLDPVHGFWGRPAAGLASLTDVSGDQGGVLRASWSPSDHDAVGMNTITHYSVWRSTEMIARATGPDPALLVDASEVGFGFEGPAILLDAATGYYWEYVGQQAAAALPGYQYSVPTTSDGLTHAVQVLAHTSDPYVSFASNTLEAMSTDDLAPAAPRALTAWRSPTEGVELAWQPSGAVEPDFSRYEVLRCEGTVFEVGLAQLIASVIQTNAIDTDVSSGVGYVYCVVAIDVHENVSDLSEPFALPPATGIEDDASLTRLMLRPFTPNPFSGSTLMQFRLPRAGDIEVTLYDLKGRAVRTLRRSAPAGWQELPLDSRDDHGNALASGIYLVRVRAGDQSVHGKVAIMR